MSSYLARHLEFSWRKERVEDLTLFAFQGVDEVDMLGSGESECRKRGIGFKGGSLHDGFGGFDGFGGSGAHLALVLFVLQNTAQ